VTPWHAEAGLSSQRGSISEQDSTLCYEHIALGGPLCVQALLLLLLLLLRKCGACSFATKRGGFGAETSL